MEGERRPRRVEDVVVVAPYNAQVRLLKAALPAGAKVGTVDKFQGTEAAVAIYSMTTSTPEDAPRGMEFLYDLRKLNFATSRAMAVAIVVVVAAGVSDAEGDGAGGVVRGGGMGGVKKYLR